MKWTSRATALHSVTKYCDFSMGTLKNLYRKDCKTASESSERIHILPRSSSSKLRTLQWNVHFWTTAHGDESPEITNGIIRTIREANADVIVLNEYAYYDDIQGENQKAFEKELLKLGYDVWRCAQVIFPTFVATRYHVFDSDEIFLYEDRSAVVLLVGPTSSSPPSERVWVVGTHLDDRDGPLRKAQMNMLLKYLGNKTKETDRIILMGDLNEQRPQDYDTNEWKSILESKEKRGIDPTKDELDSILSKGGYRCTFDCPQVATEEANRNWMTSHPPATHWTGTVIDYSYGKLIEVIQVSISPVGWSDHRMTVCDWNWNHAPMKRRLSSSQDSTVKDTNNHVKEA